MGYAMDGGMMIIALGSDPDAQSFRGLENFIG
jgi:hypothetical protein